jgi:hypothetical protein
MDDRPRHAEKVMSVFDLTIGEVLHLPQNLSTRVVFVYDEKARTKEFTVLNHKISKGTRERIETWLKENLDIEHVVNSLSSREINADRLAA